MVSPVWLQVTPKKNNEFTMTGGHDIDSGWAKEVVRGGDNSLSKFEQLPELKLLLGFRLCTWG